MLTDIQQRQGDKTPNGAQLAGTYSTMPLKIIYNF